MEASTEAGKPERTEEEEEGGEGEEEEEEELPTSKTAALANSSLAESLMEDILKWSQERLRCDLLWCSFTTEMPRLVVKKFEPTFRTVLFCSKLAGGEHEV